MTRAAGRREQPPADRVDRSEPPIEVDCQALFTEDESQVLLVLTAPPGTDAAGRLALLAVLGTQAFAPEL